MDISGWHVRCEALRGVGENAAWHTRSARTCCWMMISSQGVATTDDAEPAAAATAIRCEAVRSEPAQAATALRVSENAAPAPANAPSPALDSLVSSSLFTPNWVMVMGAKEPTLIR